MKFKIKKVIGSCNATLTSISDVDLEQYYDCAVILESELGTMGVYIPYLKYFFFDTPDDN
ncbi:MAG: hypothetical protein JJ975_05895 [Bacteroidia bacterium]|nr:hypothetical protein [Bacteroidia bacterium]